MSTAFWQYCACRALIPWQWGTFLSDVVWCHKHRLTRWPIHLWQGDCFIKVLADENINLKVILHQVEHDQFFFYSIVRDLGEIISPYWNGNIILYQNTISFKIRWKVKKPLVKHSKGHCSTSIKKVGKKQIHVKRAFCWNFKTCAV